MLDLDFYGRYYGDLQGLSNDELLYHWENYGKLEGRFGNPQDAHRHRENHGAPTETLAIATPRGSARDAAGHDSGRFAVFGDKREGGGREIGSDGHEQGADGAVVWVANRADPPAVGGETADLDEAFYASFYATELAASPVASIREHFAGIGSAKGWHPDAASLLRSLSLPAGFGRLFCATSYIKRNADVAPVIFHPAHALLHFLNYGFEERRPALPDTFDPGFVNDFYGLRLPAAALPTEVLETVRRLRGLTVEAPVFLTESDLAAYYGLPPSGFLRIFDHEYYWAIGLGRAGAIPPRCICLEHFLCHGARVGIDVSAAMRFDPDFYAVEYGDAGSTRAETESAANALAAAARRRARLAAVPRTGFGNPAAATRARRLRASVDVDGVETSGLRLFRDWIASGLANGREPNLAAWLKRHRKIALPNSIAAQLPPLATALGSELKPTAFVDQLLEGRSEHIDALDIPDSAAAAFMTALGDSLAGRGEKLGADLVYGRVLRRHPGFVRALRHRADQVQRLDLVDCALGMRLDAIARGADDRWTFINLAECHARTGDTLASGRALRRGAEAYPGDAAMNRRATDAARVAFGAVWERSSRLALSRGFDRAVMRLREALALFPDVQGADPDHGARPIARVAIVGNEQLPQCRFYRIEQKAEQLEHAGFRVETFDYLKRLDAFVDRIASFDAVVFYRTPAFPEVLDAIGKAREFGLPTFYDIDDLVFDTGHFPPALETYGGQITALDHASMACGVVLFDHAMRQCDYGIASTEMLAEAMRGRVRSGRVFVHRNAFGSAHEAAVARSWRPQRRDDAVQIFYGSGTKAHASDFHDLLEPALLATVARFGDRVRIVLVGEVATSEALDPIRDRIVSIPGLDRVDDYWDLLRAEADINLSVLSESVFNDGKSEIKWLEAAMFGIPSIVSATATHRDVIRHGETGFLCRTSEDFAAALAELVGRPERRRRMGAAARSAAEAGYSLDAGAANLRSILAAVAPAPAARPMRVLIVNVFYPPQAIGGATRVVHDNVTALKRLHGDRFHIDVACTLEGGTEPYALDHYAIDGVRVFTVTAPVRPDIDRHVEDPGMAAPFAAILDAARPDLVHFHCIQRLTTTVVDVVRRRKIPYLVTAHDGWWISDHQFLVDADGRIDTYDFAEGFRAPEGVPRRARACLRTLTGAEAVLAVSEPFAEVYRRAGVSNVRTVENGVSRLPACRRTVSPEGRVRLGFVGGLSRHKGYDLVRLALRAEAFANLDLLVVDHALEDGASDEDVWGTTPVHFVPKTRSDAVGELYGTIDVLLAPSVWPESYGLVTREALACGCWVVASDRGAVGDCVTDGVNGFRISVDTPDPLRDVLRAIDADPARFLVAPPELPRWRTSDEQAEELAGVYGEAVATELGIAPALP